MDVNDEKRETKLKNPELDLLKEHLTSLLEDARRRSKLEGAHWEQAEGERHGLSLALQAVSLIEKIPAEHLEDKGRLAMKNGLDECCRCKAILHENNIAKYPDGEIRTDSRGAKGCQTCANLFDESVRIYEASRKKA